MGCCLYQSSISTDYVCTRRSKVIAFGSNQWQSIAWTFDNQYIDLDITFICNGKHYLIFGNHDTQKYYGSGRNNYGQLGIGYSSPSVKFGEINFFRENQIKIKKVFVNIDSACTFWLTEDNRIYGNGLNDPNYQLAWKGTGNETLYLRDEPVLISELRNVIDIKSNAWGSIALCKINIQTLAHGLCKTAYDDIDIPVDVAKLIEAYHGSSSSIYTGYYDGVRPLEDIIWKECEYFKESNIEVVQIQCTQNRHYFLDSIGRCWCRVATSLSGDSESFYQLFPHSEHNYGEDFKIINVFCSSYCHGGSEMMLALDDEGVIHEWGFCGRFTSANNQEIKLENDQFVKVLACSDRGCSAISKTGRHYLWSRSKWPECNIPQSGYKNKEILDGIKNYDILDVAFTDADSVFYFQGRC